MLTSLFVGGALLVLSAVGTRNTVGAILSSNQSSTNNPQAVQNASPSAASEEKLTHSPYETIRDLLLKHPELGAFITTNNVRIRTNAIDRVPFLGDLPLLRELYNSESSATRQTWFSGDDSFSTSNWTVGRQNQTNQQWFYYRVGTNVLTNSTTVTSTPEPLVTRTFSADPNCLAQALGILPRYIGSTGLQTNIIAVMEPLTASTNSAQFGQAISKAFKTIGVDLDPAEGKTFFYHDRKGEILVRATLKELDRVEAFIQKNCTPPPQVNLKVRWVEIPQSLVSSMLAQPPTNTLLLPKFKHQNLSGILTKKQLTEVLNRIAFRDGVTLLNEGQITTLSERQAQLQVSEMKTVVTGINPKALTKPGIISTNNTASACLETQTTPLGPVIDVIPTVSPDQANISLRVTATLTEFNGYDKAAPEVPIYVNGKNKKTTLPLPKYRVQQMTNECVVPDGQTLFLGNLPTTEVSKQPNGETLTTDVTSTQTNLLFVFITATVIDPAGNPAAFARKPSPGNSPTSPPNTNR